MTDIQTLINRARALGACLEVREDTVMVKAPSPLPAELWEELRARKQEVIARLGDQPQTAGDDVSFPVGYGGLPPEAVAFGQRIVDGLGQTEPVLRQYNILTSISFWLLNHRQDMRIGRFDDPETEALYRAIKAERTRLGAMLKGREYHREPPAR